MRARPSLLVLTAASAAIASVANIVGVAAAVGVAAPEQAAPRTRLGVAIADDAGARDKTAARRGRTLDLREQAVRAAETRLRADLDSRNSPPSDATAAGAPTAVPGMPAGSPTTDQFDDLARIYQAMKPASAALVLEQLDLDVQMRVAQKMRERSTAMILAAMTPKGAAALTMALARRGALRPVVKAQPGRPMAAR